MKAHCTHTLCAYSIFMMILAGPLIAAQPVYSNSSNINNLQQYPDVDEGVIVWAEQIDGDWDVYGWDLLNPSGDLIYIAAYVGSNQDRPSVWYDRVVYQDDYFGDWDVWVSDISDANIPANYLMTLNEDDYIDDQINPVIHGNTAVWQNYVVYDGGEDWDIYAADITDPNNASVYLVDDLVYNQTNPAIHRSTVVYQDDFYIHWDIVSADVWLKDIPQHQTVFSDEDETEPLDQTAPAVWGDIAIYEHAISAADVDIYARDISLSESEPFAITTASGLQQAPDISGHIVVWQDNRNGNWDIYGYNLVTKKEFQITTNASDQTQPAVSGSLVAWKDERVSPAKIYYTWLDDADIADCPVPLAGDVNGDCRVDLIDYAAMAQNWMLCNLVPASACSQ